MEKNGIEHNYFYYGLEQPCAMMLFIKHYSLRFGNVMPAMCKTSCPVLTEDINVNMPREHVRD